MTLTADELKSKSAWEDQETALFEAAFQEHWTRIYGVLFRLVGDRAEAEDLALETFWQLYRRQPTRDQGLLVGWLYRVATNLGFNALRSRKRRDHYEEQAGRATLQDANPLDPAREVERNEERRRVRSILAQMKPRLAQILVLRYSGLSYAELANALGVASSSIGTLLARAERDFEQRYRTALGENR